MPCTKLFKKKVQKFFLPDSFYSFLLKNSCSALKTLLRYFGFFDKAARFLRLNIDASHINC